jgi:hypothetical protein
MVLCALYTIPVLEHYRLFPDHRKEAWQVSKSELSSHIIPAPPPAGFAQQEKEQFADGRYATFG